MTKKFRIYGQAGHRQAVSFMDSFYYDFTTGDDVRILSCDCSDRTGTNDYVDLTITRNTAEECEAELDGQLSDGIFENCTFGIVEEI